MRSKLSLIPILLVALAPACQSPMGGGGNPPAELNIKIVSGDLQTDSAFGTLDPILLRIFEPDLEGDEQYTAAVRNQPVYLEFPEDCGTMNPVTPISAADGHVEVNWTLGDLIAECTVRARLNELTLYPGTFIDFSATTTFGQPIDELYDPGTGASAIGALTLSPVDLHLQDQYQNPADWEIQLPVPGPILLSTNQTPSGTAYVLTAIQGQGDTEIEVHTRWGLSHTLDVRVCQVQGGSEVRVFNPTEQTPTPPCPNPA